MKRWSNEKSGYVRNERIDRYLDEVIALSRRHGLSIAHEDHHGAFVVEGLSGDNERWLRAAHDGTKTKAGMRAITSVNVANAMVKLVAADALPALVGELVIGNLVSRDYEPVLAHPGIAVSMAAPESPSVTLTRHAEETFQIPDITKVLAVPDLLKIYMSGAVCGIARRIEGDLLALYSGFTAEVGQAGVPIAAETAEAVSDALPFNAQKYLVVDAGTYSMWRRVPGFQEFMSAGDAGLRSLVDGTVGKIGDFFVLRSQSVVKTGTGPTATHNLAFTRDAMGLAMRRPPMPLPGTGMISEYAELGNFGMRVSMQYQPNTLAQQFTVEVLYGCGILRSAAGVQVTT